MHRGLRVTLVAIGVVVVLLLLAPFVIPVNQFRPTIEDKASMLLGRKVELGKLSLSLIHGSLSAEHLSIGDDPGFGSSPFLTARALRVGVKVLPLIFSRTLEITGVTIDSPQVTLLHNPAGQWNFSSFGGAGAKPEAAQAPATGASAPPPTPANFFVEKLELTDGSIIVGATNSQKRSTYDHVNVTASGVSMTSTFPVAVRVDLPAGGWFALDGHAGPVDRTDTSLTPFDAKLTVTSLNLASTGLLDSSAGLGGLLDFEGTLASHGGEAETKGTAKLSKALLVAGGSPAGVPVTVEFETRYNLRRNAGVLNPSALSIGHATAHLNGTYNTAGDATAVQVELNARDMPARDLQSFLPALGIHLPRGASLQAGTLNADLKLSGTTSKYVIRGNVGLFKGRLAGFDLGSKLSAVGGLAGLKTGSDLDIEKLTTGVRVAPDGLEADHFMAVVPQLGNLTGAGTVDSRNNLDFKMVASLSSSQSAAGGSAGSTASSLAGIIGKVTASNCVSGMDVPFQVKGTTADPKFVPDVGGLAADMFKSQMGCLGAGASGAKSGTRPKSAVDALGALFKKKK